MGALAVVMAVVAYALYVWKSLRGEARPHPLSWLIFGVLGGTGFWCSSIRRQVPEAGSRALRPRFVCCCAS